jgi:hypothetical protein
MLFSGCGVWAGAAAGAAGEAVSSGGVSWHPARHRAVIAGSAIAAASNRLKTFISMPEKRLSVPMGARYIDSVD